MDKKIYSRKFLNPLWIIVVFCSLTEITLGYAVFNTKGNIQLVLTCFVIAFPLMIAILFFLIVWHKPTHLYAPVDYKKDESFLNGISNNKEIPVNVYLNTNDEKTIQIFQTAFKEFVRANGLTIVKEFPPKKGSWIGRFSLRFKNLVSKEEVKELLEKAKTELNDKSLQAIEQRLQIEKKRIEIEKLKIDNLEKKLELIKSLSNLISSGLINVDDVTIQVGSLLLVKTKDETNQTVISNFDLDEETQAVINDNEEILRKPKQLLQLLNETKKLTKE